MFTLYVQTADFGYNKYYEYGGLSGVSNSRAYDVIQLHPGSCRKAIAASDTGLQIQRGLTTMIHGSTICLEIIPELEHRNLGGRVAGGRVVLTIDVAHRVCSSNLSLATDSGVCVPICSTNGQINNCPIRGNLCEYVT